MHRSGARDSIEVLEAPYLGSSCGPMVCLLRAGVFLLLAVLESVALSIHLQNVNVVGQAIQQRA